MLLFFTTLSLQSIESYDFTSTMTPFYSSVSRFQLTLCQKVPSLLVERLLLQFGIRYIPEYILPDICICTLWHIVHIGVVIARASLATVLTDRPACIWTCCFSASVRQFAIDYMTMYTCINHPMKRSLIIAYNSRYMFIMTYYFPHIPVHG